MPYKKNISGEKFIKGKMLSYPTQSEDKIQQEIYLYLQNNYCTKLCNPQCVVFAVPNQNQWKLTNIGVVAGVSDLIFLMPNRIFFIEIKTQTGTQSDKQKSFEQKVKKLGFEYILVRSLEELKTWIQ